MSDESEDWIRRMVELEKERGEPVASAIKPAPNTWARDGRNDPAFDAIRAKAARVARDFHAGLQDQLLRRKP